MQNPGPPPSPSEKPQPPHTFHNHFYVYPDLSEEIPRGASPGWAIPGEGREHVVCLISFCLIGCGDTLREALQSLAFPPFHSLRRNPGPTLPQTLEFAEIHGPAPRASVSVAFLWRSPHVVGGSGRKDLSIPLSPVYFAALTQTLHCVPATEGIGLKSQPTGTHF